MGWYKLGERSSEQLFFSSFKDDKNLDINLISMNNTEQ